MRILTLSLTLILCLSLGHVDAQNISDEAMRHFDRGQAAIEIAKSPSDYEDAVKEFKQAVKLAPDWADGYYNLYLIQEKIGNYDEAIKNLKQYLQIIPNANDAATVKRLINKLEFKADKIAEKAKIPGLLEGKWQGYGVCCNGKEPSIQFRIIGDMLSVRIPVTWNADMGQRIDYKSYPVEIEGQTIRFEFKAKLLFPARNDTSYCNIRYELKLIDRTKLQGKQFSDGKSIQAYFEKLN